MPAFREDSVQKNVAPMEARTAWMQPLPKARQVPVQSAASEAKRRERRLMDVLLFKLVHVGGA